MTQLWFFEENPNTMAYVASLGKYIFFYDDRVSLEKVLWNYAADPELEDFTGKSVDDLIKRLDQKEKNSLTG